MCRLLFVFVLVPLLARADDLDVRIRNEMQKERVPGLTFAVVREGESVRLGVYGFGNLEWQAHVTNGFRKGRVH